MTLAISLTRFRMPAEDVDHRPTQSERCPAQVSTAGNKQTIDVCCRDRMSSVTLRWPSRLIRLSLLFGRGLRLRTWNLRGKVLFVMFDLFCHLGFKEAESFSQG